MKKQKIGYFHLDKDLNIQALKNSPAAVPQNIEIRKNEVRRVWINGEYAGLVWAVRANLVAKTFRQHGHRVRIRKLNDQKEAHRN